MRLERIDSIFDFEKGTLQSTKCDPGEFDFITASREWKTHKEFTHDKEALVIAVAASGSLGRTHYANGKFTASDLCFILTPKEGTADNVSLPFYQFVFNGLKQDLVKKCATGTAKQAINRQNFSSYLLPLFEPDEQERMAEKLRWAFESQDALETEITHQQTLLGKLKQGILQEAIQGKLTEAWRAANPDVEPASELLKRIQAEKARLIAEKKIRKEKPLPEITPEEIPFEIPEGWEWCRLGVLGLAQTGTTPPKTNPSFFGTFVPFIKPGDILDQKINYENEGLSESGLEAGRTIEANSILMVCIGSSTGKVAITDKMISCNQQINSLTLCGTTLPHLVEAILASPFFQERLWDRTKTGITPIINKTKWCSILIPLPPLAEQAAIVERVETLMATCRDLETEIERSRTHAADLLQAVLKEAFAPAS